MAVGALFIATTGVWVSFADASPGTASVYRCLLALPFLVLLAIWKSRGEGVPSRRQLGRAAAAGVLFSGDMLLWTQAITEVGAGLTAVLVNLQVVFVPALAWIVDNESVPRRYLIAVPVVLLGVIFTSGVIEGGGAGAEPLRGTVHATMASLCYSGFLFLLRSGGRGGLTMRTYVVVIASATVASMFLGAVWRGVDLTPGWGTLGWLLLVAVCGQVLGWLLVAMCLPHLPSHTGALLLLLTPVGALALGALVLAERPTPLQLFGSALILISVLIVTSRRATPGVER
ncbi:DMT family transporter [Actinopolyspora saharensis]|uniref:DMT family transporter n=1 Tax=Actinopolyspora saharensis TaxID=995062 RepID=UPI003F661DE9